MKYHLSLHLDALCTDKEEDLFCLFVKDVSGKYLGCNDRFANVVGCRSEAELIGRTDYDLCWHDAATVFQANDQRVIVSEKPLTIVEHGTRHDGSQTSAVSYKFPLRGKDLTIMGVIGTSVPFEQVFQDPSAPSALIRRFKLTQRQADCVSGLMKGMTIKEIAHQLQLSARTVEHYLEAVKLKLNCNSRSQIISAILDDKQ